MKDIEITCRNGIKYETKLKGSKGEILRTVDMLSKCCCWVCFNHNCNCPDKIIPQNCNNYCELFTDNHYCNKNDI